MTHSNGIIGGVTKVTLFLLCLNHSEVIKWTGIG
nr:MAG TPA: hypothetical protein [Caudoviricetes sp.]DAY87323.1 MAG TPA: hypothetical protein [Caudoviricetes sp.]